MTERVGKPKPGTWEELDAQELEILAAKGSGTATESEEPCASGPDRPPALGDDAKAAPQRPGWPPGWRREPPREDLFGLGLSGGGIRSATFNLGVLQGLAEKGLLDCFHYLSTVSGGGYVGGFWSAWRARVKPKPGPSFPPPEPTRTQPEAPEIRHLREFSNFLRPRTSLFEIETARIVSALISGVVPCIVIAFAAILFTLGLWWLLAWLFTGEGTGTLWPNWAWGLPLPMVIYAAVTAAILHIFERRLWQRAKPDGGSPSPKEAGGYWFWAIPAILASSLLAGGVWLLAPSPTLLLLGVPITDLPAALGNALFPILPWLIAAVFLLGVRVTFSRCFDHNWEGRMRQAAIDRIATRLVLAAATWSGLALAWVGGQLVAEAGLPGVLGALSTGGITGGLFAWIRRTLLAQTNEPAGRSRLVKLSFALYQTLAYVTLIAVVAGGAALIVVVFIRFGATGLLVLAAVIVVIAVSLIFMDPHEIGLHKFYRARLVRAYLGPSNIDAYPRGTAEAEKDDLELSKTDGPGVHELPDKPLHLICCAANDLAGDPLGSLGRGAESAVASKLGLQVGDRYRQWECMKSGAPWLADVLTASGAAFNSHMGQISVRLGKAVTFLLTALGLRLGLWLENPINPEAPEKKPRRPPPRKRAWGYLFLRELISNSRIDTPWIHLSDGAHFENLALYELVRRHCRFILISDCGADPDRAFDDFGNAVRRVREDFGVEIKIDISPLKADPTTGRARQPMVAGDIHYPPAEPGGKGDAGVLLYVKPTLTGREPPDVAQYAERNEQFPHESTIDQFYDEAQWESYRRLGQYAIHAAFDPLEAYLAHPHGSHTKGEICEAPRVFTRARYYWPPISKNQPDLDRLEKEWGELQNRLDRPIDRKDRRSGGVRRLRAELSLQGSSAGTSEQLTEDDLIEALPAVQEAIRLMEQVFLRTEFGRDDRAASSRLYMGWFNRFGLWASAPIFRAWWPKLAPFRAGEFTDFLEEQFKLQRTVQHGEATTDKANCEKKKRKKRKKKSKKKEKKTEKGMTLKVAGAYLCPREQGRGGYARARFDAAPKAAKAVKTGEGELYELYLDMPLAEAELNAGVVRVSEETTKPQQKKTARWKPEDFYVPPGLWAIGVGERFVDLLIRLFAEEGFDRIVVQAPEQPNIHQDAIYMGAGFEREKEGKNKEDWCYVLDLEEHRPQQSTY